MSISLPGKTEAGNKESVDTFLLYSVATERSIDTKSNIHILSIFPKHHNFWIVLTVISATSILFTRKNLHLIYENAVENEPPFDRLMTSLVEHVVNIKYA